jgi:hypothetical protein
MKLQMDFLSNSGNGKETKLVDIVLMKMSIMLPSKAVNKDEDYNREVAILEYKESATTSQINNTT